MLNTKDRGSLSVVLSQSPGRSPESVLDAASLADELGFDELWIGEMAMFDAFVLATAVAARTTRIDLTVGPLQVSVRTPVGIAMGVGSVRAVTGRRINVALGTSSPTVVSDWHGRNRTQSATQLAETAEVLRLLLAGGKVVYEGEVVSTRGFRLLVPAADSSITVAAFGRRAITTASLFADRMVLNLVTPRTAERLNRQLKESATEANRLKPRLAAWVPVCIDPEEGDFIQKRRSLVGYLAAPGYRDMFAEAGFSELVEFARSGPHPRDLFEEIPDELVRSIGAFGSGPEVLSRIDDFRKAGIDEVVLNPSTASDPGGLRTLTAISESLRHD